MTLKVSRTAVVMTIGRHRLAPGCMIGQRIDRNNRAPDRSMSNLLPRKVISDVPMHPSLDEVSSVLGCLGPGNRMIATHARLD